MPVDWAGMGVAALVILAIIAIVIAKIQGDRVVDVLQQFVDFMKGDK